VGLTILINCSSSDISLLVSDVIVDGSHLSELFYKEHKMEKCWVVLVIGEESQGKKRNGQWLIILRTWLVNKATIICRYIFKISVDTRPIEIKNKEITNFNLLIFYIAKTVCFVLLAVGTS
jgi:hypothetical protein